MAISLLISLVLPFDLLSRAMIFIATYLFSYIILIFTIITFKGREIIEKQKMNYQLTGARDFLYVYIMIKLIRIVLVIALTSVGITYILLTLGFVSQEFQIEFILILLYLIMVVTTALLMIIVILHMLQMDDVSRILKFIFTILAPLGFAFIGLMIIYTMKKPLFETTRTKFVLNSWYKLSLGYFFLIALFPLTWFIDFGIPPTFLFLLFGSLGILYPLYLAAFYLEMVYKNPDILIIDKSQLLLAMKLYNEMPQNSLDQAKQQASKEVIEYLNYVQPQIDILNL